jgi:hypothetical protein
MIRYAIFPDDKTPVTLKSLCARVLADATNHADPKVRKGVTGWLKRAKVRTKQLLDAGAYIDLEKWKKLPAAQRAALPKPIDVDWSSVKHVFMLIQNEKCGYCERKVAARGDGGAKEHDLEHFRPKNPVKAWPAPKSIDFPTGAADASGYYWLAFHLLNYCTACTKCNSGFKSNYFPVAGPRLQPPKVPTKTRNRRERPFLVYPLGALDDDPEDIVRFRGIAEFPPLDDPLLPPKARADEHRSRRSRVVIAFFGLNRRDELLWGRAERLRDLEKSLQLVKSKDPAESAWAKDDIRRLKDGYSEHTACVRAMIRLYHADFHTARVFFDAVRAYLNSKTPKDYFEHLGQFLSRPKVKPSPSP